MLGVSHRHDVLVQLLAIVLRQQPNVQMHHTHFIDIFPLTTKIMCVDLFDMVCFVATFDVNLLNLLFGLEHFGLRQVVEVICSPCWGLGFCQGSPFGIYPEQQNINM